MTKTRRKSRTVKSVQNLPAKGLGDKEQKGIQGGLTLNYGSIEYKYTKQEATKPPRQ